MPKNITAVLALLHILLDYGRHLTMTVEHRAATRGFSSIAQFFGTARMDVILARLTRGILRIMALEKVLRARAARGRDLVLSGPRKRSPPQTKTDQKQTDEGETEQKPPRRPHVRHPDAEALPDLDNLPSVEQLIVEIRRRPIGCALADICRDLGVAPSMCDGPLWNALLEAITWLHGNLPKLVLDLRRRQAAFEPEWDRDPNLGVPEQTREGIHRILGFFIGQPPSTPSWVPTPLDLETAAAARPP